MKPLFRQRFFSWFDSYDIYDEDGNTVYVVRGSFLGTLPESSMRQDRSWGRSKKKS